MKTIARSKRLADEKHQPLQEVARLETELHLPEGFFEKLIEQDDWSFIIKLHALFEAALSHVIVHRLGCDALADAVSYMDMSDKRKGKVVIASALGLLVSEEKGFLDILSELRNVCAHDIREAVTFNLVDICAAMKPSQQMKFIKSVCGDLADEPYDDEDGSKISYRQFALKYPKVTIWTIGMHILAHLCLQKDNEELRRRTEDLQGKLYEVLRKKEKERERAAAFVTPNRLLGGAAKSDKS
jgi:hypothetical protein